MQGINAWNVDLLVWESFCLEVYWKYQTITRNGCQVELCLSLASSQLHCFLLGEVIEWDTTDTREPGLDRCSEHIKCIQSLNNSSMYVFNPWYSISSSSCNLYATPFVKNPIGSLSKTPKSHRQSNRTAIHPLIKNACMLTRTP